MTKAQENPLRLHFSASGVLGEGCIYLERPADQELFEALLRGEYCYLLAPPKTGKSSLRVRVAQRLLQKGVRCATIDLRKMDRPVTEEGFYYAVIVQLAERLGPCEPSAFFERNRRVAPAERWARYLRDELMPLIQQRLVVFIDEVDAVRSVDGGADGFFAVLRGLFADRQRSPAAARLTFCLIGSAAPEDLVRDPGLIPLDITRLIELSDFTPREAQGFLSGLAGLAALNPSNPPRAPGSPGPSAAPAPMDGEPARALERVLYWTDGHPFMTQQVCEELLRDPGSIGTLEERIDRLVEQLYLQPGGGGEELLGAAKRRFEEGSDSGRLHALSLYRRLLFGERVPAQREDRVQLRLRFAGAIKQRRDEEGNRWLQIRNRVFTRVLGASWIEAKGHDRLLTGVITRWLLSGKDPSLVLRGQDLEEALAWARPGSNITKDEEEFLRAGLAVRQEEELRLAQEQLTDERRLRQAEAAARLRERRLILSSGLLLSFGALLWLWTLSARARRADEARAVALSEAQAVARRAEAQAAEVGRAQEIVDYAVRRMADTAGEPAPEGAWALLQGGQGRSLIDGLATLSLARQEGALGQALLSGLRAAAPHRSDAHPPLYAVRGLYGAVAAALTAASGAAEGGPFAVLAGHGGVVRAVAFGPGGQVLTGSDDQMARLWDAQRGRLRFTLAGHGEILRGAAFSPDGAWAVTTSHDRTARLWRTEDGRAGPVLRGHTAEVVSAAFSPTGQRVVTASGDGTARIWDARGGEVQAVLRGHGLGLVAASFSADGQQVLTASQDGTAILWSAQDGKALHVLRGHRGALIAAHFSPRGDVLLTAGVDHTVRLWDRSSAGPARVPVPVMDHGDVVTAAAFSPDGARVLSAGLDRSARLWDAQSGRLLATLSGHAGPVTAAVFSPDGGRVLTVSQDRSARLWDVAADGRTSPLVVLRGHGGGILGAAFSPDGGSVVTAGMDRAARVYPAALPGFLSAACRLLSQHPELPQARESC
jgi:WD40 repeat protein